MDRQVEMGRSSIGHWEWHALPHTFCGGGKLASEFIMWLPLLRFISLVKTLWGVNVNKGTLFQKEMALWQIPPPTHSTSRHTRLQVQVKFSRHIKSCVSLKWWRCVLVCHAIFVLFFTFLCALISWFYKICIRPTVYRNIKIIGATVGL